MEAVSYRRRTEEWLVKGRSTSGEGIASKVPTMGVGLYAGSGTPITCSLARVHDTPILFAPMGARVIVMVNVNV